VFWGTDWILKYYLDELQLQGINDVFAIRNKWFKANKLTSNFDKTNFMKFATNNKTCINLNIGYYNKTIEEVGATEFLAL
jgi:hypothetical protein